MSGNQNCFGNHTGLEVKTESNQQHLSLLCWVCRDRQIGRRNSSTNSYRGVHTAATAQPAPKGVITLTASFLPRRSLNSHENPTSRSAAAALAASSSPSQRKGTYAPPPRTRPNPGISHGRDCHGETKLTEASPRLPFQTPLPAHLLILLKQGKTKELVTPSRDKQLCS